ncbi:MAG: site-specific integrase [Thaumarchaeota archaeon]|nr:site-specific integrase [Nitrososphaerota archaeon]
MPSKGEGRYRYLLDDPQVKRWYDNVSRGSLVTCEVYLRKLGWFLREKNLTHQELLQKSPNELFELLLDTVSAMEREGHAGSYVECIIKSVKSWLVFNHIQLVGKIRIRGTEATPTLVDEQVPTQGDLNRILNAAILREKVSIILIATMGGRIEVLGNYDGSDGLRVRDIPEMVVDNSAKTVTFQKVPTMISVRGSLSKAKHQYFSFLCEEGCGYLREYLEQRMREGERLTGDSPVILRCQHWQMAKYRKNPFISTRKISNLIRYPMRKAGIKARPYVLRNYFDNRLLVAESEHHILRDFGVFFMGHKGDIEHRYTLNRSKLPADLIEKMRDSYRKSQKYLMTVIPVSADDDVSTRIRRQMLLTVGYRQEEMEKLNIGEMSDEAVQDLMRQKLVAVMMNNGQRQKVVSSGEVERSVLEGWEWIGNLSDGRAVLRLPM